MKSLPIITLGLLIGFTLSACSTEPAPTSPTESSEKTAAVEESTTSESENILDLKMENALKELDMVE